MPDGTRSGNPAANCPTVNGPPSARRSRICRRVGSANVRNTASVLGITCIHQLGQSVENSMDIGATLIVQYRLTPVCTTNVLESVVNERDPGAGSNGSKCDH